MYSCVCYVKLWLRLRSATAGSGENYFFGVDYWLRSATAGSGENYFTGVDYWLRLDAAFSGCHISLERNNVSEVAIADYK